MVEVCVHTIVCWESTWACELEVVPASCAANGVWVATVEVDDAGRTAGRCRIDRAGRWSGFKGQAFAGAASCIAPIVIEAFVDAILEGLNLEYPEFNPSAVHHPLLTMVHIMAKPIPLPLLVAGTAFSRTNVPKAAWVELAPSVLVVGSTSMHMNAWSVSVPASASHLFMPSSIGIIVHFVAIVRDIRHVVDACTTL